jgi:hypothetical protein
MNEAVQTLLVDPIIDHYEVVTRRSWISSFPRAGTSVFGR